MKNLVFTFLISILLIGCKSDETDIIDTEPEVSEEEEMIDENYFKMFTLREPYGKILFDGINDLIVMFDTGEGKMITYDYNNKEILATKDKSFFIAYDYLALFSDSSKSEVYIGIDRTIYIYDSYTLEIKDSLEVFSSQDTRHICGITVPSNDIIIVGACNSSGRSHQGSISIDKETKSIIAQARDGENCLGLKHYKASADLIGVVGAGFCTNFPSLVNDIYSAEGELIENNRYGLRGADPPSISSRTLAIANKHGFFITSGKGNLFRLGSLEFIQSLNGNYTDLLINEEETKIYGLSVDNEIDIINIETLDLESVIPLENLPICGILDENKIVVVYFDRTGQTEYDIYLSLLDI